MKTKSKALRRRIRLDLPDAEYRRVRAAAAVACVSMAEFARRAVLASAKTGDLK